MYKDRAKHHYLREWREKRNLSQLELAKAVGTSKSIISRYEAQQCGITMPMLFKLLDELKIMPNQFFEHPDEASVDTLLRGTSREAKSRALKYVENILPDLTRG